jgi:AcrR family transcriptional regulator
MKSRQYQKKKRAETEEQTRLRITESTVQLHGTLGPARTSISAIAGHAGVRRSTVYRHFPDETALFTACTSHWLAANPFPGLARWVTIQPSQERLRVALRELYGYYRRTGPMLANVLRDEETMPVVREMLVGYRQYLAEGREILVSGFKLKHPGALRRTRAAIGHALAFEVWRSLCVTQGLGDAEAADLMCLLVEEASRLRGNQRS